MQFVKASYGGKGREYTYHNAGAPLAVGDIVTAGSKAKLTIMAVDVDHDGGFETKAVTKFEDEGEEN